MKKHLILAVLFTISLSAQAQSDRAATCTPVEVDISPLDRNTPRNQRDVGWCYAVGAADMMSVELGRVVSASNIAANFNYNPGNPLNSMIANAERPDLGNGGFAGAALSSTIRKGAVCNEDEFSYEGYLNFVRSPEYQEMLGLREFWQSSANNKEGALSDGFSTPEASFLCSSHQQMVGDLANIFGELKLSDIAAVMRTQSRRNIMGDLIDLKCAHTRDPAVAGIKVETTMPRGWGEIDRALNGGKMVGFSYNAGILGDKDSRAILANHVSTLIGRRFNSNTQQCEYLIRNSWGPACGWQADYDPRLECEHGNIWMPQESLNRSLVRAYYIK